MPMFLPLSLCDGRIEDDEEEVGDNEMLGDGAEGVASAAGGAIGGTKAGDDGSELPPELRMDDYDDEPGLEVTGSRADRGELGGDDDSDAMDEDGEEEDNDDDDDDEEEDNAGVMGSSMLEEPTTGQVFAYESEGEDSDTEDNIIKPGDHVLLTASTEEVNDPRYVFFLESNPQ